jgi:hypothetical protein
VCQVDEANTVTQQRDQLFHWVTVPAGQPQRCARLPEICFRRQPQPKPASPGVLGRILLHLVEGTARHLGHIDLLLEQADGNTGEERRRSERRGSRSATGTFVDYL